MSTAHDNRGRCSDVGTTEARTERDVLRQLADAIADAADALPEDSDWIDTLERWHWPVDQASRLPLARPARPHKPRRRAELRVIAGGAA